MKFGFDLHGVIDARPEVFAAITNALYNAGHEIHVITGPKITTELMEKLYKWGIKYTHFFSIVDYHEKIKTPMNLDHTGPHLDPYLWDKTKGDYCSKVKIDLHFDDSDIYGHFFKTAYARFYSKDSKRQSKLKL